MSKQYENQSPWRSQQEVENIKKIAVIGNLWKTTMSDQEVTELYNLVMNPPEEIPGKIEESL